MIASLTYCKIIRLSLLQVVRIMAAPQVFFDTQHLLCGQQLQPVDKVRALHHSVLLKSLECPFSFCHSWMILLTLSWHNCWLLSIQGERALGGAVAALGLSQKAVHADDEQPDPGGGDGAFSYSSGSDLAPNPVPSASAGMMWHTTKATDRHISITTYCFALMCLPTSHFAAQLHSCPLWAGSLFWGQCNRFDTH